MGPSFRRGGGGATGGAGVGLGAPNSARAVVAAHDAHWPAACTAHVCAAAVPSGVPPGLWSGGTDLGFPALQRRCAPYNVGLCGVAAPTWAFLPFNVGDAFPAHFCCTAVCISSLVVVLPPPLVLSHRSSCLLYTSPSPRDRQKSRMPSSA